MKGLQSVKNIQEAIKRKWDGRLSVLCRKASKVGVSRDKFYRVLRARRVYADDLLEIADIAGVNLKDL